MTMERALFEYQSTTWDKDGLLAVVAHEGGVLFTTEQEHAVDSYNEVFVNQVILPLDKARELALLILQLAGE